MDKDERLDRAVRSYESKRYRQALQDLMSLDENPAENIEIAYYLGLCHAQLGEYDEALVYLEQVVTTHTDILRVYQGRMLLAYIYCMTKRYKLAEFELKQVLASGFESAQVYSACAFIQYEQDMVTESLESLRNALELDPGNANAHNSLGFILADEELELENAVRHCKVAVKSRPEYPAYLDSLGWACYKLGRYEEAREYLRKAYSLSKGNREITEHLRIVLDIMHTDEG
jgi:tetratricopeptide (TPR) repeat protein